MDSAELLLRTLMQLALLVLLLATFISSNGGVQRAGPILYIPFFLGLPAIVVSLLVLAPLEGWLRAELGVAGYGAVVAVGALLPWVWLLLIGGWRRNTGGGGRMLSVIFGGWALLWIATRPLYFWLFG